MSQQSFAMVCGACRWKGNLGPAASDKCPECGAKLRLQAGESRKLLQRACGEIPATKPMPMVTMRYISDRDAPKNEGEWEFRLSEGVLTIIAWDDEKVSAKAIRLVRRGTDIHLMQTREEPSDDAE